MLKGTVDYLRTLLQERDTLLASVKRAGKEVPAEVEKQSHVKE